jgi:hypothetical protein
VPGEKQEGAKFVRAAEAKNKSEKEDLEKWDRVWKETARQALEGKLGEEEAKPVRQTLGLPQNAAVTQREAIFATAVELAKQGKKEWAVFLRDTAQEEPKEPTVEEEAIRLPELGTMTDKELRSMAKKLQSAQKEAAK